MENKIKVSVIIPAYNVEKYIERCILSVINQTLKEIEIIIVNDGSNDNTKKIIEKFLGNNRIIYIEQKNSGLSAARNAGLKVAKGDYISFIDSDDYVDNNFIEKLYNALIKNNADVAASSVIRKYQRYQKWRVHYTKDYVTDNKDEQFNILKYPNQSYVWNKLYSKKFLNRINYKFVEGKYYEDILATLNVLLNCKRICAVKDTNYYYMVNDKSSITKSKKTVKKETDRYNNQKEAIELCIKNNIKLNKKEYFIKKSEIKFLNIPILKIKENVLYKKEQFILFNIIPFLYIKKDTLFNITVFLKKLFSINNIDQHIIIMFLFIKLKLKYRADFKVEEIKASGINDKKRDRKIIASLTTFPERINTVKTTVKTLMNQTVKPDEIVLYLAEEQFKDKEKCLPCDLLELKNYGLQIKWCNDIKSYKKLIPALKEYKDDIIITFDDDIYYEKDTIEALYNSYLKYPNEIQANRCWRIKLNKNNEIETLDSLYYYLTWENYKQASFFNTIIGAGAVLYPPNSLYKDVSDENKFKEIIPTQDDIWFWAMAVLNGTKIRLNKGYSYNHLTVENTQQYGLCKINNKKSKGMSGKIGFRVIVKQYPEIIEILKKD